MTTNDTRARTGEPLASMLRAWASGLYPCEAAVDLLIGAGLHTRVGADPEVVRVSHDERPQMAAIDWQALYAHADAGPYSGGERRILLLACGLAGEPVPIDVSNLDSKSLGLVLAAVSHAAGWHERRRAHHG